MEKTKKFDVKSIIFLSILAVSLIMAIVGICIPWASETVNKAVFNNVTINDYFEKDLTETSGFWIMFSLALVTILANAVVLGVYILSKFVKTEKFILLWCICILLSCGLVICSGLALYFTRIHIDAVYKFIVKDYYCYLGAGVWLLSVFGVIGGITGITAFCCLAFKKYN